MKRLAIVFLMTGFFSTAEAYYGRHSVEAILTYESVVDAPWRGSSVEDLNGRLREKALLIAEAQIQHLMGTFQSGSFLEEYGYPGVLGEDYQVRFTGLEKGSEAGRKLIRYRYEGKVSFQKDAFRSGKPRKVPLKLPLAPDRIYELGVEGGVNLCTDRHYNDESDFWYFWDPDMKGCPLKGDAENVLRLQGELRPLPNTRLSYPEYDRLYGDNGNGDKFELSILLGYADDITDFKKPNLRDDAVRSFKQVERELLKRGFEVTESKDAFRLYRDGRQVKGINFLRRFERGDVVVTTLLADTSIGSRDVTFRKYLVEAFADADILVYDGHSGLGDNLDLMYIPEIRIDPKKYQLYFFNGCSSYPYYNGKFFKAKGGSRNLDVITSGLPTYFETAGPNLIAFIDSFVEGKTLSYQRILQNLERSNGDYGTYLIGVNGDEDNRWKPSR